MMRNPFCWTIIGRNTGSDQRISMAATTRSIRWKDVTGFIRRHRTPAQTTCPFEMFRPRTGDTSVYNVTRRISPIGENVEVFLSVSYPPDAGPPVPETLSINMLCTNSHLPESLQLGRHQRTHGNVAEPAGLQEHSSAHGRGPASHRFGPALAADLASFFELFAHLLIPKISRPCCVCISFRERATALRWWPTTNVWDGVSSLSDKIADRLISGVIMRGTIH